MTLRLGNNTEPEKMYLGSNAVSRIYKGSEMVWEEGGNLATTAEVSSYTFTGDSDAFEASSPFALGSYTDGSPFILSDRSITFTKTGDPSVDDGSGHYLNGMMEDPYFTSSSGAQGFDGLYGVNTHATLTYSGALNKDQAVSSNYAITENDTVSLVKSSRTPGATTSTWGVCDKYRVLTIVAPANHPNEGDFRPGMSDTDKTSYINAADISFDCCQSVDVSSIIGLPSYAATLALWPAGGSALASFGPAGEVLRVMQVLTAVSSSNYSSDLATLFWASAMHLHSDALTVDQKRALSLPLIQAAIDLEAAYSRGWAGAYGAGQHEFYHYLIGFAAALTNSQRLQDCYNALKSNIDQARWASADQTGSFSAWPYGNEGGEYQYVHPMLEEYEGQAYWSQYAKQSDKIVGDSSLLDRSYFSVSGRGRVRSVIPLAALKANRSMPAGPALITGGGAQNDVTVPRGAAIHLVDLERTTNGYEVIDYMPAGVIQTYDLLRPLIAVDKMDTFPPAPPLPFMATAGASQVSWDISGLVATGYGSVGQAITGVKIEASQDGVQFVQISTSDNSNHTEIPGIPVWYRAITTNANGNSAPTYTHKNKTVSTSDNNKVIPTGTPVGAVVNTTAPMLMQKKYPANRAPIFIAATGGLTLGTPLYCGIGYWTGNLTGAPTIAFETATTEGGSYSAAAGSAVADTWGTYYKPVAADSELWLRGKVVWGGVTVYTAAVQLGTLASIPAGFVVDTDFGVDFPLVYATAYATITTANCNAVHAPMTAWPSLVTSPGGLWADKTGSYFSVKIIFASVAAGDYRVKAEIPVGMAPDGTDNAWKVGAQYYGLFRIRTTTPTDYFAPANIEETIAGVDEDGLSVTLTKYLQSYDDVFTWPGGDMQIMIYRQDATGLSSGGDIGLTKLSIELVS